MKFAICDQRRGKDKYNVEIDYLEEPYHIFFANFGVKLFTLSNYSPAFILEQLENYKKIDLILLTGGNDIAPLPDEDFSSTGICINRDQISYKLISYALEKNIPLIGICRGMQIINCYFGGTIERNIPIDHHMGNKHPVYFSQKNHDPILVNSFHNHYITKKNLGKDLLPLFHSQNDIIEGITHEHYKILGLQFHPERPLVDSKTIENLIKHFIYSP